LIFDELLHSILSSQITNGKGCKTGFLSGHITFWTLQFNHLIFSSRLPTAILYLGSSTIMKGKLWYQYSLIHNSNHRFLTSKSERVSSLLEFLSQGLIIRKSTFEIASFITSKCPLWDGSNVQEYKPKTAS
jgi:hypothetical protein